MKTIMIPLILVPILLANAAFATDVTEALQDAAPSVLSQTLPDRTHIGKTVVLRNDRSFYQFNPLTGKNEVVVLPAGTRLKLDRITETDATRGKQSYFNYIIVGNTVNPDATSNENTVWITRQVTPSALQNQAPAVVAAGKTQTSSPQSANFSIRPGKVWAPACTNFLDENGNPGPWGRAIMTTISNPAFQFMLDATKMSDVKRLCPAYGNFDSTSKKKFWAFFIASMVMSESSCNPKSTAQGPNGKLAGLMQLHSGRETSYGCSPTNSFNPISNLVCGLTMLKNQVTKYGNLFVGVGKTYWQVLWMGSSHASRVKSRFAIAKSCKEGAGSTPSSP